MVLLLFSPLLKREENSIGFTNLNIDFVFNVHTHEQKQMCNLTQNFNLQILNTFLYI